MSKVTLEVIDGTVAVFPFGMSEDKELLEDGEAVQLDVHMHHPVQPLAEYSTREQITQAIQQFLAALKAQAQADIAAPAFGSASRAFNAVAGSCRVHCDEGVAIIRVYHALYDSPYKGEGSPQTYLDPAGEETADAWSHVLLLEGQSHDFTVIESNAITAAFYA